MEIYSNVLEVPIGTYQIVVVYNQLYVIFVTSRVTTGQEGDGEATPLCFL